jgi:hypothetical protein
MFESRIADCGLRITAAWIAIAIAAAQESPTPSPSAITEESPSSISPGEAVTPPPASEQTPSASPARSVLISFVPPPLEGTISLGIYDASGKLVRVLHQEAELNEFTIGEDALITQWDGKNDDGTDLPAGRYHARGYLVGHFKVDDLGQATTPPAANEVNTSVQVKLIPNLLANDKRSIVDLSVGFDSDGSFLKTADGLPLFTLSESPNLGRVLILKRGEKSVDIWQDNGSRAYQFHVTNLDRMMAFDCGDFELK